MPGRPIIECMYGWGQIVRLYRNHLEVNGILYSLDELASARSVYRRTLGVSSTRLEFQFKHKTLVLRGIADQDNVQKIMDYMNDWSNACHSERIDHTDALSISAMAEIPTTILPSAPHHTTPYSSPIVSYESLQEYAQAPTIPVKVPQPPTQYMQHGQHSKRLQRERLLREHGFDVEQLELLLQAKTLPQVSVPVRLLADEYAHFRTEATLSGEPLLNSQHYRYRVKDQGMLIFTNKRIIYLGRKCQIVLGYARLLHVSRLQGAIAFLAEHWSRREIFELAHPLECAMYLESILKRFQQQEAQGLSRSLINTLVAPEQPSDDLSKRETMPLASHHWNRSSTPAIELVLNPTRMSEIEQ